MFYVHLSVCVTERRFRETASSLSRFLKHVSVFSFFLLLLTFLSLLLLLDDLDVI